MGGPTRSEGQSHAIPTSISTSSSASWRATTARRCAASIWRMSRRDGRVRTLLAERQDRPRHAADRRDAHARQQRQAGALFRDQRRRRAVPLHRHLSSAWSAARCGSAWTRRRRTARRRTASSTSATSPFAARARSTSVVSNAPNASSEHQHRVQRRRAPTSPARPGRMTIRDGVVRGPMIGATIEGNIDYARDEVRDARHAGAALRPQQHVRADSDRRPVPRRRQQRGHVRHHLRGDRPDQQSARRWSIRSRRSRRACCASSSNSASAGPATAHFAEPTQSARSRPA